MFLDSHWLTHRIRSFIGKSNIWQFALKMQLARLLVGDFEHQEFIIYIMNSYEYCMERNPCLQPKWRTFNLPILILYDSPSRQIKATAKYTTYMVAIYL